MPPEIRLEYSMNKLLSFFVGTCLSLLTTSAFAQIQTLKHWQVSIDGGGTFRPITVPSTIEDSIDLNFDGVSIYQTQLPADSILQLGQRAILKFCAVATQATVYVNEQQVATHL